MLKSCCLISSEVIDEGGLGCAIEFADDKLAVAGCGPTRGEPAPGDVGSEDPVVVSARTAFSGSGASTAVGFPLGGWRLAMRSCGRSEERRVGKECRAGWGPEH